MKTSADLIEDRHYSLGDSTDFNEIKANYERIFAAQRATGRCEYFSDSAFCRCTAGGVYSVPSVYAHALTEMALCLTHANVLDQTRRIKRIA